MKQKFYEKDWFMWVMLFLLAPVGIFLMWKYKRFSDEMRKILTGVFIVWFLYAIGSPSDNKQTSTNNNLIPKQTTQASEVKLSESDKSLLKKSYKDFDSSQRVQFEKIVADYKDLSESAKAEIRSNFERLSKEKDEQLAKESAEFEKKKQEEIKTKEVEEAKNKQEFITKNTKKLSAGEYIVGTHLDEGAYEITFNGSGNFVIYSSNGGLLTNEIGGTNFGISKYRTPITNGSKIKISGMSINVKPIVSEFKPYGENNLYAGYWIVGQDIAEGRYKVTSTKGSGNFIIYSGKGSLKTNEILGEDFGVSEAVVNLKNDDIISISSMDNVKFTPTN